MFTGIKIKSKKDLLALFERFEAGALKYRHVGDGRLNLGSSAPHYDDNQAQIEGFMRLLWGAGPRSNQSQGKKLLTYYYQGILSGVDPNSPNYWGTIHDYDQFMVELASLDMFLLETKELFWIHLSDQMQKKIVNWISQINQKKVHDNNWRFFRILTNVTLKLLDQTYSQKCLDEDLEIIDACYVGDGWYFDGSPSQQDYYIAWAFHYYGLLYAHYMSAEDPYHSAQFISRAKKFAQTYIYLFDQKNGAAVPFGRSLTYKFAQSAFWSMLVYTNIEAIPWGQIKQLIFNNLDYWSDKDILRVDGVLAQGYAYDNQFMTENYNGVGSPYWAMKIFILLAVPESHPFWNAELKPTKLNPQQKIATANMLITNNDGNNVQLFPVGQYTKQLHAADKYSKFVYSTNFGFSVQRGPIGLDQGAFDNVLAIAMHGDNHFRPKEIDQSHYVDDVKTVCTWSPLPGVLIRSLIIPLAPWHIRIHIIRSDKDLDYADGGFAIPTSNSHIQDQEVKQQQNGILFEGRGLSSAAFTYIGEHVQIDGITPVPDTNLLYQHTVIPTVKGILTAGESIICNGFLGVDSVELVNALAEKPTIIIATDVITIFYRDRQVAIKLYEDEV